MSAQKFDLTDKVAVITGAGTGIGRATALLLSEHGADIVAASRRVDNLESTAERVRKCGRSALVHRTDIRDAEQCRELIDKTVQHFGRVDILVNNAGGSRVFRLADWTPDEFDNSIALNQRGMFFLTQAAVSHMAQRRSGVVVNISSIASEVSMPGLGPYGAAKAGVNALTRLFASEYGRDGVRVNGIIVGFVKSEGFTRTMNALARDPDAVAGETNAIGRAGLPEEVAYSVLFLASPASSYVSGETIHVTGGPSSVGPW
jgi:NAD(P)-dependent dehydrogenase (short-subunit alcohol dehydrogenase family)